MDNRARLVPPVGGKRCASARCDAYGSLLAARYTIGRALGDLVAEGYFDAATAERAARSILSGGGTAIFGLERREADAA